MTELDNSSSTDGSVDQNADNENDSPTFAVSRIQEELILGLIRQAEALGSTSVDLCHKGLTSLPTDLLQLSNLEHIYLEGNELTTLPDNLFEMLPNLQWLDLRGNHLSSLPMFFSNQPPKLRNLLLEGNNLTTLPPELGLIKSLNGLNIRDNPLTFPPPDVIELGTQEILRYLREVLGQKSAILNQSTYNLDNGSNEDVHSASSNDDDWQKYLELRRRSRASTAGPSRMSQCSDQSELAGPVPQTLELHEPASYSQIKAKRMDKLKKTGADGSIILRKKSSGKSKSVSQYPAPPPDSYIDYKMAEERKLAKEKEYRIKQEAILQRRRDEESLKGWRNSAKKKQQKKYLESLRNGGVDFEEPVKQAPYGVDKDKLKMMTREEKIKEEVRATHEKMKRRPMTPGERLKLEEEKAVRIRELERRIKAHTLQMVDRRRLPKSSAQEEMRLTKQELDVAQDLQKELTRNRQTEYRFRAFTADLF